MAFYDLSKQERINVVANMSNDIGNDLKSDAREKIISCFKNGDTYIRKSAYQVMEGFTPISKPSKPKF